MHSKYNRLKVIATTNLFGDGFGNSVFESVTKLGLMFGSLDDEFL
jgi:hypothetical protein